MYRVEIKKRRGWVEHSAWKKLETAQHWADEEARCGNHDARVVGHSGRVLEIYEWESGEIVVPA